MADLKGALLAAAEEADKMQQEIAQLVSHVEYLDDENNKLKTKLKDAVSCLKTALDILSED